MIEDILSTCYLDHKVSWVELIPLVEFDHKNSYQAMIKMILYKIYVIQIFMQSGEGGECVLRKLYVTHGATFNLVGFNYSLPIFCTSC